jgi:tRNA (pseudouridine54-N1)-methyltransferase
VTIGHRSSTDEVPLDDLPGRGGRFDVLCRFVAAALLVSHGVRTDASVSLVLSGPPNSPRTIRLDGASLRQLRPDERSTAATLRTALRTPLTGSFFQETRPGLRIAKRDLAGALEDAFAHDANRGLVVLDEAGDDIRGAALPTDGVFVVGDYQGFTDSERALLAARGAHSVSVGPRSLQSDQTVTVLWNELDRRTVAQRLPTV